MNNTETLFVEKYRPQTIEECVLPENLKGSFKQMVAEKTLPNMLLCGTAGLGKTTVAKALCAELGLEYIMINASEDNGIDVLRSRVRRFASIQSLRGGMKVIILDEADHLNANSTQPALRGFIEEFSNCRFILTCNFKNKIIEPLHSRCSVIEFNSSKKIIQNMCGQFLRRLVMICEKEGIKTEKKILAELITQYAPDWRRVLNEVQRHSIGGELLPTVTAGMSTAGVDTLIEHLKAKNFREMRKWVALNPDMDSAVIFRLIYDKIVSYGAEPSCMPNVIVLIGEYQFKAAFVSDKEINTAAFLTECMSHLKWK